jgi:hypothetical protein
MKKKVAAFFFLNKTRPNFSPQISTDFLQVKKWIFSGRVFCADSEYMLDAVNELIYKL